MDVDESDELACMRDITLEQAKREIVKHLKAHDTAYISEIAENLGIEIELAFKAVQELEKEGVVGG